MVILWLRFALRQLATTLVVVTSILLLSEILLPASILPYFNLHILVFVTLAIALMSAGGPPAAAGTPPAPLKVGLRLVILVPIATSLLAYAWFMFGTSMSGLALFVALAVLLAGVTVALCHPAKGDRLRDAESGGPTGTGTRTRGPGPLCQPLADFSPWQGRTVVEDKVTEEELDIFMR